MKTEFIAAVSLAGVFAFKGAENNAPVLTEAQKQQITIHATCSELNKKFIGDRDVYARDRVTLCRRAVNMMHALIK